MVQQNIRTLPIYLALPINLLLITIFRIPGHWKSVSGNKGLKNHVFISGRKFKTNPRGILTLSIRVDGVDHYYVISQLMVLLQNDNKSRLNICSEYDMSTSTVLSIIPMGCIFATWVNSSHFFRGYPHPIKHELRRLNHTFYYLVKSSTLLKPLTNISICASFEAEAL